MPLQFYIVQSSARRGVVCNSSNAMRKPGGLIAHSSHDFSSPGHRTTYKECALHTTCPTVQNRPKWTSWRPGPTTLKFRARRRVGFASQKRNHRTRVLVASLRKPPDPEFVPQNAPSLRLSAHKCTICAAHSKILGFVRQIPTPIPPASFRKTHLTRTRTISRPSPRPFACPPPSTAPRADTV